MLVLEARPHRSQVLAGSEQSQKIFLMLRLRLDPDQTMSTVQTRVAASLAVDTSGSMYARLPGGTSKIDRAIESIASIASIEGIDENTWLSIVQFDTDATALLPLQPLDADAEDWLDSQARRLRNFGGGTNLDRALSLVLTELEGAEPGTIRKAVILTDGETTDEWACLDLAKTYAAAGIPLLCVGLGVEYNEDFLAKLADQTNGFLYHLSETEASMTRFREALEVALLKSKGELATDVRLSFDFGPHVELGTLTRVYPMVQEVSTAPGGGFRLGNIGMDGEHVFVAELELSHQSNRPDASIGVNVTFDVPSVQRVNERLRDTVRVTYTTDRVKAGQLDQEVVFFVQQARVRTYADQAVELTRMGKLNEARKSMMVVHDLSNRVGNVAMSRAAERAAVELTSSATLQPDTAKSIKNSARTLTILSPPTRQQGFNTKM